MKHENYDRIAAALDADVELNDAMNSVAFGLDALNICSQSDEWCEPTPLPNPLPPVDPFDAELLPLSLRPWVMDIAHLMQCPPDFPAVGGGCVIHAATYK